MRKCKQIRILAACCAVMCLLSSCKNDYVMRPSGTNENAVNSTFNVPERYKNRNNSTENTGTETEQAPVLSEDETSAVDRRNAFVDIIQSDSLYVELVRMRSYGEASEEARMTCVYAGEKAYYAMYNANDDIVQEVYSEGDTAWLIDRDAEKKLETDRSTYKYCYKQTLCDLFVLSGLTYTATYNDSIDGKTLLCDEYTSDDSIVRYYYDTAENLILIREIMDNDEINSLFYELTTLVSEDLWDKYSVDYVTEKLIK